MDQVDFLAQAQDFVAKTPLDGNFSWQEVHVDNVRSIDHKTKARSTHLLSLASASATTDTASQQSSNYRQAVNCYVLLAPSMNKTI